MFENKSNLTGFSLPFAPHGLSSLVDSPPWFFGGDGYEVFFRCDPEKIKAFIPYPLTVSDRVGLVCVTIVDMTSVDGGNLAFDYPERAQYRECLFKIHCEFEGKPGWFVPATWVDKDFSLLRGFIQGFGKKLSQIHITKLHHMNPMIGGRQQGARIKAICESFARVRIELELELQRPNEKDLFAGNSMFVMRHFPDTANAGKALVHDISELVVHNAKKTDFWDCSGDIRISGDPREEVTSLIPETIVAARCFSEGFELHGGRVLYDYLRKGEN